MLMFAAGYYLGSSGKKPTIITNADGSISIAPEPLPTAGTSQQTQPGTQQVLNGFRW